MSADSFDYDFQPDQAARFRTPQDHVDKVRLLCHQVANSCNLISEAYVDDWGRFSNFSVIVRVKRRTPHTTRQIRSAFRKALSGTGLKLRAIHPPAAIREWVSWGRGEGKYEIVGYDRDYWALDIDCYDFCPETNRFHRDQIAANNCQ